MKLRSGELPEHVRKALQAAAKLPTQLDRINEINRVVRDAQREYPHLFKETAMKIRLQNVRLAFPALFQPQTVVSGEGDPAYSATFILEGKHPQIAEIKTAIDQVAQQKWGEKAPGLVAMLYKQGKLALQDGDLKANYDGFSGNMYISARNKTRPTVVDRNRTPLTAADGKPYAGCYVNAVVELWAQDNQYGKRINASLGGVQFAKEGEAFGGGGVPVAADDFEDLSTDEDDMF